MSDLFLTKDEIADLTGYTTANFQRKVLDQNQIRYALNKQNEPKVVRQVFIDMLSIGIKSNNRRIGPNVEALRKMQGL